MASTSRIAVAACCSSPPRFDGNWRVLSGAPMWPNPLQHKTNRARLTRSETLPSVIPGRRFESCPRHCVMSQDIGIALNLQCGSELLPFGAFGAPVGWWPDTPANRKARAPTAMLLATYEIDGVPTATFVEIRVGHQNQRPSNATSDGRTNVRTISVSSNRPTPIVTPIWATLSTLLPRARTWLCRKRFRRW